MEVEVRPALTGLTGSLRWGTAGVFISRNHREMWRDGGDVIRRYVFWDKGECGKSLFGEGMPVTHSGHDSVTSSDKIQWTIEKDTESLCQVATRGTAAES